MGVKLTELNEEFAVTLALIRRQNHDARQVISFWRLFLLGKISHDVAALLIDLKLFVQI